MSRKLLWSASDLHNSIGSDDLVIVDCRFSLAQANAGKAAWLEGHVPGARYAHLDDDLSSPVTSSSGRHPLPEPEAFSMFLAGLAWEPGKQIVAYDNMSGAFAGRLWWLMKYFGHDCVSLLDGGFSAWTDAGYALESGNVKVQASRAVELEADTGLMLTAAELAQGLQQSEITLVDARAPERFKGTVEPLDKVAGHIPGAVNYPFQSNLDSSGRFRPVSALRDGLESLTRGTESTRLVHMCGSGVTACHNLFAAELAGIRTGKLYAGSWSEWIQDPQRPVSR